MKLRKIMGRRKGGTQDEDVEGIRGKGGRKRSEDGKGRA